MKIRKILCVWASALALFLFSFSAFSHASSGGISWISYEKGIALAEKEQKKLLIYFYTDRCTYCEEMDEKTFKDPAVVAYINKNFIPVRVNSQKERKTAQIFRVRGVPDTWFMSETKDAIGHQAGFISAENMIQMLKWINSGSYKSMSLKNYIKNQ